MQELLKTMGKSEMPHVISFHGMDINRLPKEDEEYKINLLALNNRKNTYFTSPSLFLERKMVQTGLKKSKIEVIPNVYSNIFNISPKDSISKKPGIICVGRFEKVKGHKYLIKAIANLSSKNYNFSFTLVGKGSLENEIIKLINKYDLEDNVSLINWIPHHEIPELLKKHDIFVLPSIRTKEGEEENFPISLLEATALGLFPMASNIGGIPEIINKTGGILFDPENSKSIEIELKAVLNNHDIILNSKKSIRATARKYFSQESQLKNYYELYKNITQ